MLFNNFLELLSDIEKMPLPAQDAHIKMAPAERVKFYKNYDYSIHKPRKSAVLSLFYPKDTQTYLLLIVRSEYPGVHSAQISFPGGKMEPFDQSLQQTALRETEEEVGIPFDKVSVIKQLSEIYIPPSNFIVYPFMGISHENIQPNLNEREVSKIIELPLHDLLDDRLIIHTKLTTSYGQYMEVPAFDVDNHIVWGATAMILNEIKESIYRLL